MIGKFSKDGEKLASVKLPTPKSVDEYVQTITNRVKDISDGQDIDVLSMALPGVVKNGVAVWCHNLGWRNVAIRDRFQQFFPKSLIVIDNDANLAGLASMRRLESIPRRGLYITIGTGVGTAIVLDGKLHGALNDCEGGHMMLEYKGRTSTWENLASGRVIDRLYGELSDDTPPEVWPEIANRINIGLRTIVAMIQPEIVVIGGVVSEYVDKFDDILSGLLAESLPYSIPTPRIIAAPYPRETVIYGCYDNAIAHIMA